MLAICVVVITCFAAYFLLWRCSVRSLCARINSLHLQQQSDVIDDGSICQLGRWDMIFDGPKVFRSGQARYIFGSQGQKVVEHGRRGPIASAVYE